jgi:hypothetical protein
MSPNALREFVTVYYLINVCIYKCVGPLRSLHSRANRITQAGRGATNRLSRPDLREPFYVCMCFGPGVICVGILCLVFLCVWPSVVLNQRQLSIVVSHRESYLGSLFPPMFVGSCPCIVSVEPYRAVRFVGSLFLVFLVIIKEYD